MCLFATEQVYSLAKGMEIVRNNFPGSGSAAGGSRKGSASCILAWSGENYRLITLITDFIKADVIIN